MALAGRCCSGCRSRRRSSTCWSAWRSGRWGWGCCGSTRRGGGAAGAAGRGRGDRLALRRRAQAAHAALTTGGGGSRSGSPRCRWCSPSRSWRWSASGGSACRSAPPCCSARYSRRPTRCWPPTCRWSSPDDRDRLRFALTGEAGLNDGTAFPFVMLGLGLLGLHDLGTYGGRWLAVDVALGRRGRAGRRRAARAAVGRLVLYLRREHKEAVGLDDFLALGLIALGLRHGAAGARLRLPGRVRGRAGAAAGGAAAQRRRGRREVADVTGRGRVRRTRWPTDPETAPAYMAQAVLGFNEQLERHGRGRGRAAARRDAPPAHAQRGRVLGRPAALPRDPPAGSVGRAAGSAARRRCSGGSWLVRHPRHRLGLLPDVRREPRPRRRPSPSGSLSLVLLADRRECHASRALGDAGDGLVSEAGGKGGAGGRRP